MSSVLVVDQRIDVAELMKGAFRRYPTGVAVISAAGPDGPVGLTASSVASVSVAPSAVSFSVMGTQSAHHLLEAPSFIIHLLGSKQADLARLWNLVNWPDVIARFDVACAATPKI